MPAFKASSFKVARDRAGSATLYFQALEVVPEPSSILLLGPGLIALGAVKRRRRDNSVVGRAPL